MSLSDLNDELAQVRTKKKGFLEQIERIVPLIGIYGIALGQPTSDIINTFAAIYIYRKCFVRARQLTAKQNAVIKCD